MNRELLGSERRRVLLLLGVLAFLLAVILLLRAAPGLIREELRPRMFAATWPYALLLLGYAAYETGVLAWLGRLLRTGRKLPMPFRYLNLLVEISLPTLAMVIGATVMEDPLPALVGAIPLLYFLFIFLAVLNLDLWLCLAAGLLAGAQFLVAGLALLKSGPPSAELASPLLSQVTSPHQYLIKSALFVAGGAIAGFVARQIRRQLTQVLHTLEERDRAISIFGQHVSPQVADLLLKQPLEFAGQERRVCVMFLDVRDFSRLASERTAPEVMSYLNQLFEFMIPVVNQHQGIVNKFLGDGFMAVFGAPVDDGEQCRHAIQAARDILSRVDALNGQEAIPPTRLGIGLHMGQAVTGNVGATERKEYTIIGDVVNVASRIEQATKQLQARLLVSQTVIEAVGGGAAAGAEDMGPVELKGQPNPIRLFKLA